MIEITAKEQTERRKVKWSILVLSLMIVLIIGNDWVFRNWLKMDYVRWYIDNGVFISLGFSFVSLAWGDLDEFTDIISADPLLYFGIYFMLMGGIFLSFSTVFRGYTKTRTEPNVSVVVIFQELRALFDTLISGAFLLLLILVIFGWLIIVAPIQYFVYLVAGALAREMLQSKLKMVYWKEDDGRIDFVEVLKDKPKPEGAIEVGFFSKPVTLTSSVAAIMLWALSQVV